MSEAAGKPRILLVDDNSTNRMITGIILKGLGCEIESVSSGLDALAALRDADYDLVFMDLNMPHLDGAATCRMIRSRESGVRNPEVPVIALTAAFVQAELEKCQDAGMRGFLNKPASKKDLEAALARWLPGRKGEPPPKQADASPAKAELFDEAELLERLAGDKAVLKMVVEAFLKDSPGYLAKVEEAIESGDPFAARKAAHSLKGAAASISARALRIAAANLEWAAESEELEKAKELLPALSSRMEELRELMKRLAQS